MSYINKEKLLDSLDKYDFPNDKSYEVTFEVIDSEPAENVIAVMYEEMDK